MNSGLLNFSCSLKRLHYVIEFAYGVQSMFAARVALRGLKPADTGFRHGKSIKPTVQHLALLFSLVVLLTQVALPIARIL